ncbi:MAG: hypothetical protein H0X16_12135 [Chloroflexi bacterium]|nr:hypothetical protein [Chloroflexota bacterium]
MPRRIGPRRLLPYEMMGLAAMITAGALAAREEFVQWRPGRRRPDRRVALSVVAGGLCILAGLGIMGFGAYSRVSVRPDGPLSYAGRDAYLWLARNTEPDDRVLVNGYTDGVVTALSRRPGITDGRAPYGEDPEWQAQAVRDARLARAYFAAPSPESLAALRPDYVVVAPAGNLGTAVSYRAAQTLIEAQAELRPVAEFGPVTVYEAAR